MREPKLVQEAATLFEADARKLSYTPGNPDFLVSPLNSRSELERAATDAICPILGFSASDFTSFKSETISVKRLLQASNASRFSLS